MKGNKKSLVDAMEKGINLRGHIMELFESYYHGALMRLVVIGGGESFYVYSYFSVFLLSIFLHMSV